MSNWFENEEFWRELYPFMFSEKRFQEAEGQAGHVLQLIEAPVTEVLDLCCGPGRFSLPLARKGYAVTGVDRSPYLLGRAREAARREGLPIEFVQADMREFRRPGAFDLVLSTFTSFGYFDNRDEDLAVLELMFENLRPGGHCLIDLYGKELLAKAYQPSHTETQEDGAVLLMCHEIFDDWTRIRNAWTLIRGETARTFHFHHTLYSGQELRDRLERAGFDDVRLYGSFEGAPYGIDAERLIAVGQRSRR